ncbi:unnamed protein product [Kuraishia capsulata CBS 1993]|uniref:Zn(2)-C6 fungal-type domain-containing protein n=1 Tax=Kuraishia capsulata CBS 1993 TaxID=1382522 RepID=W6MU49_9ASCO|nr:uncharacterized protein KUCA_T00004857001 [Kuraishia capsulata CBS 1993]CDK28872.1 unnamed protein product [Kuraishia capsulata CBS 1993]
MALRQDDRKRRVGKACDCCRIKKTKCDGKKPCSKCTFDNKVCVYSERKRHRDKVYQPGYVELLETRLELLSKSLETLCRMVGTKQDLAFLDLENTADFSVNKVIAQLIDHGLETPLEGWDGAALVAANFSEDAESLADASRQFATHDQDEAEEDSPLRLSQTYTVENSSVSSPGSLDQVFSDFDTFPLDLGPFSSGAALAAAAVDGSLPMSAFESASPVSAHTEHSFMDDPPSSINYPFSANASPLNSPVLAGHITKPRRQSDSQSRIEKAWPHLDLSEVLWTS